MTSKVENAVPDILPLSPKTLVVRNPGLVEAEIDREIVTLKYLDGFSYDEIAGLLKIPRGTVMSRLFYARKELQAKLTGKFH